MSYIVDVLEIQVFGMSVQHVAALVSVILSYTLREVTEAHEYGSNKIMWDVKATSFAKMLSGALTSVIADWILWQETRENVLSQKTKPGNYATPKKCGLLIYDLWFMRMATLGNSVINIKPCFTTTVFDVYKYFDTLQW